MKNFARLIGALAGAALLATAVAAQDDSPTEGQIDQMSTHVGRMSLEMDADQAEQQRDSIRFEPYQMLDDLMERDDLVFLMRHGPTDWSFRDEQGVASTDCENQRVMTEEGKEDMYNLGILMAANGVRPGKIVVSEWCRNQQTVEHLLRGMRLVDEEYVENLPVETDPALNLLLSLNGAPDVTEMREMISNWDGSEADGPLLLISHFTNIEELTTFNVYEGEMLVLDPKRDNRVRGYLRLRSAEPDVGHFNVN